MPTKQKASWSATGSEFQPGYGLGMQSIPRKAVPERLDVPEDVVSTSRIAEDDTDSHAQDKRSCKHDDSLSFLALSFNDLRHASAA